MKKEIVNLKCPKCKMEVDPEAIKCPYCRSKLKHSKIIQAFIVIVFVGIIISVLIADSNSNTTPNNIVVPVVKPVVTKTATPQKQISYEIIKHKHKGEIEIDSTLGVGTKITIKLPQMLE